MGSRGDRAKETRKDWGEGMKSLVVPWGQLDTDELTSLSSKILEHFTAVACHINSRHCLYGSIRWNSLAIMTKMAKLWDIRCFVSGCPNTAGDVPDGVDAYVSPKCRVTCWVGCLTLLTDLHASWCLPVFRRVCGLCTRVWHCQSVTLQHWQWQTAAVCCQTLWSALRQCLLLETQQQSISSPCLHLLRHREDEVGRLACSTKFRFGSPGQ